MTDIVVDWDLVNSKIEESIGLNDESPGPDWFTAVDYLNQLGAPLSSRAARERLNKMETSGLLEARTTSRRKYYRIVK